MAELLICLSLATVGSLTAVLAEYAVESFLNIALKLLRSLGIAKRIMPDAKVKVWLHESEKVSNDTLLLLLLDIAHPIFPP